jgi:hypothetical protein
MLGNLIEKWRIKRAIASLENDPLYKVAVHVIRETIADDSYGLGKFASQNFKEELAGDILKEVSEVIVSEDRLMANREKLSAAVLMMVKYQILILPSEQDDEEEVTGLRGKPGISGELKSHILEISEKDKEIKELAWALDNPTEKDIYEACLFRYWAWGLRAQVFQTLRIQLKDHHPKAEKDWYRPFVEAMCAWEEHNYREAIGLPDILSGQDEFGSIAALKYSTFMNMVMDGTRYPNLEFQEYYSRDNENIA